MTAKRKTPIKKKAPLKRKTPAAKKKPLVKKQPVKRKAAVKKQPIKAKKVPAKMGRPTGYRVAYNQNVLELCMVGFIDDQIAEVFEISVVTLRSWKKKHPDFLSSMKRGKAAADGKVATGLYNRAIGMTVPDTHVSNHMGDITLTPIEKHLPPDPQSARFWLKNRQPELWKENFALTDTDGGSFFGITINENPKPDDA